MLTLAEWWALGTIPWLGLAITGRVDAAVVVAVVAVPTGFLLQQLARFHLEVVERAFDHPKRPALTLIRSRWGGDRGCSAEAAYRIYEVTLYQRGDWSEARAHIHRCWHWVVTLRAATFATVLAIASMVWASFATMSGEDSMEPTWVVSLAAALTALALWRKGEHTKKLLHEFDCAWILAHWPAYEAVAMSVLERGETTPQIPAEEKW